MSAPAQAGAPVTVPLADLYRIASEHEQAGRLDDAERLIALMRAQRPDQPDALHLAGIVAARRQRYAEAAGLMQQALARGGTPGLIWRNICEVYRRLGRLDEAVAAGRRAVALAPNDAHALVNLAIIHYDRLELEAGIACCERAIALAPDLPGAHFELSEALLLGGDFARGWEEYEWRFQIAGAGKLMPKTDRPQWDGKPLREGTLLLIGDQGFGDVIQFSRYIPWAAARCPDLVLACSKDMHMVVRQLPGVGRMFDRWEDAPPFTAFCPLSGLPRAHGTRPATVPAEIPYLRADPVRVALWASRLDALLPAGYRRVGIAWAGRPTHNNDHNRSMSLASCAKLAAVDGVALVSLQKGPAAAQVGRYVGAAPLLNLGPEIADWGDTMAILEALDLVVTVDTSVGHLAGAMGKPAWMMLPYAPDWRWLLGRSDTPWYPTMRLFRQPAPGRWDEVLEAVVAELDRGRKQLRRGRRKHSA
ncbi:MAG: glycosyltransferase family protein [Acidisphaera sp.]|nr:glycosyltransferase family protein [Acidisphaera sp.]